MTPAELIIVTPNQHPSSIVWKHFLFNTIGGKIMDRYDAALSLNCLNITTTTHLKSKFGLLLTETAEAPQLNRTTSALQKSFFIWVVFEVISIKKDISINFKTSQTKPEV